MGRAIDDIKAAHRDAPWDHHVGEDGDCTDLARAAAVYALAASVPHISRAMRQRLNRAWPWPGRFKSLGQRADLVTSAALLVEGIRRHDRDNGNGKRNGNT